MPAPALAPLMRVVDGLAGQPGAPDTCTPGAHLRGNGTSIADMLARAAASDDWSFPGQDDLNAMMMGDTRAPEEE